MRFLKRAILGIVLLYVFAVAALYAAMNLAPGRFANTIANLPPAIVLGGLPFEKLWTHARAGHLQPGDAAPDFELPRQDKTGTVRLSSHFSQRPVVLIFGSYT